jgi:hypothetical protein
MSAASDRIQELVYPTKPRLYVGLGDPPDTRVTADDLKAVIDERAALLTALRLVLADPSHLHLERATSRAVLDAIAKAQGGK